jgi:hypothetical protein
MILLAWKLSAVYCITRTCSEFCDEKLIAISARDVIHLCSSSLFQEMHIDVFSFTLLLYRRRWCINHCIRTKFTEQLSVFVSYTILFLEILYQ